MTALETYIREFTTMRGRTVPETSYYGNLKTLLDDVGRTLRPTVQAVIHPHNTGVGIPDLGLIDDNQPAEQKPAHGVVEAKPISNDLMALCKSKQVVEQYLPHYGQVFVTNYYQFALVTADANGKPVIEEIYKLADSEKAFWEAAAHPRQLAETHEAALREYLLRVMRRNAKLSDPRDVAWILASYARDAIGRIEAAATSMDSLKHVRQQLEAALGVKFEGETAEEFFRSSLVQTIFYGIFSTWVLWYEGHREPERQFNLWSDIRDVSLPAIQELFEEALRASTVRSLNIREVLDWTANALNRVDKVAFFERFEQGDAVQYFYEPFLEAFDPELREQLGVWYTPSEVVEYMVARVDTALREELGIRDGLLNEQVYVLDPCCGTGAYLVAVLKRIYERARQRDGDLLAAQTASAAIQKRIAGFEILPAPFVVAHLQIGMLLNRWQAPFAKNQRAAVYLTNALTGWEERPQKPLDFPELQKERDAAEAVKQEHPILVVLGNPPYFGRAQPPPYAMDEERSLTDAYRTTQRAPAPQGQGLNDLYVRFYRMAERRIIEQTQQGIVCFISNYSWLDGLSYPGMREHYLDVFDSIYVDNLHGDRIISEYAPDGHSSETVFAIRGHSAGIKVGTSISLMVRKHDESAVREPSTKAVLHYRDMHQSHAHERRAALLDSLKVSDFKSQYQSIIPMVELGLPFKPRTVGADYLNWPKLPELFPTSFPGVKTSRDDVLVDVDKDRLIARMQQYFDPAISHDDMRRLAPGFMDSSARYNAEVTRDQLRKRGFLPDNIVRYAYRPFDTRWLYWEPETKLLDEKRAEYFPHSGNSNPFIFTTNRTRRGDSQLPLLVTLLNDINSMDGSAAGFPLYLYNSSAQPSLFENTSKFKINLSDKALDYLKRLETNEEIFFYHVLAILHSSAYRLENGGAMKQDWPRVPLPVQRERLVFSAELGQQVASLLDMESPVEGVTEGEPHPNLREIGKLTNNDGGAPDFNVNKSWGYFGRDGIVMSGQGSTNEHEDGSRDVYLNETTYWKNIPAPVWEYTLGGYPVLKKWLSYRETRVLGRPLKAEEARTFMHIARRIAALIALQDALDANYRAVTTQV